MAKRYQYKKLFYFSLQYIKNEWKEHKFQLQKNQEKRLL